MIQQMGLRLAWYTGSKDSTPVTSIDNGVSKHERAYRLIRARILDGTFPPGHRLVLETLAAELGISPVPVREAIRRLEAEGRVHYRHNAGARVAPADDRQQLRIGIDVGGSSTDAVVMDGATVVAAAKRPTTADVTGGIAAALDAVLREARPLPGAIAAVLIGTTHFASAFAERRVTPTACVRLALPSTAGLPPAVDWPEEIRAALSCGVYLVHGGHEFDGRVLSPLRQDELRAIGDDLRRRDVRAVAISAVFSPISPVAEQQAGDLLQAALPDAAITLSHQIGRLGLLERENAAMINASLCGQARTVVAELRDLLRRRGIGAPLFLTQNDGTLMTAEFAARFPVLTFSSGQANSIRGAGFLAGLRDALVVDAGGSAIDIGALIGGFPREAGGAVRIGGVRTNFRMPHVLSLPVGGGTIMDGESPLQCSRSLGASLLDAALIYGGSTPTLTDLAVAAGLINQGDAARVAHLRGVADSVLEAVGAMVRRAVDRAGGAAHQAPLILVGGSAWLARTALAGREIVIPEHHEVANAVGAATAPVSGEVDRVVALEGISHQEALAGAVSEAVGQAVAAGADPVTVRVAWADDVPLAYLPGTVTRIRVKATGTLAVGAIHGG
jgi:N-methylhydantoinase A/oxoprolinase/acetone carboxylase beta subunit